MRNTRHYLQFLSNREAITSEDYEKLLHEDIQTDLSGWQRFLRSALLSLGLGLLVSGLVFLLAFNWDALSKAQQLGIAGLGVAVPAILSLTPIF